MRGLVGRCDFLLSRPPEQLTIEAPEYFMRDVDPIVEILIAMMSGKAGFGEGAELRLPTT